MTSLLTRNTLDCDLSNYSSRIVFPTYRLNLVKLEMTRLKLHEISILDPAGELTVPPDSIAGREGLAARPQELHSRSQPFGCPPPCEG